MAQTKRDRFGHNTIALVYDFDGTLTPQPMQEYTVLPKLGIKPQDFWENVRRDVRQNAGDEMLTYLRLLLDGIETQKQHVSRADLAAMAKQIRYFPGVHGWFDRINDYVRRQSRGLQSAPLHHLGGAEGNPRRDRHPKALPPNLRVGVRV